MDSELNKLIAEKMTLQKQLGREKSEIIRLTEQLQETEGILKRRSEEVEALQIYNNQLIHKCESLQANTKQSQWGTWWGAKNKTDSRILVLEEELANKITENEQVHIKIFEIRQKYKLKISDLKERLKSAEELVRDSADKIESQSIEILQYQKSIQGLLKEKKEYLGLLDDKNKELLDMQSFYMKTISDLKNKVLFLENKLRSVVSLDLTDFDKFNKYIPVKFSKNLQFKQNEWISKVKISLKNSVEYLNGFWAKYCTRLNAMHLVSSASTKKIVSEITNQSLVVNNIYEELVLGFFNNRPKHEIMKMVVKFDSAFVYFIRLLNSEISRQKEAVLDFEVVEKGNSGLMLILSKISTVVSRVTAFLIASGSSTQCFWTKIQECIRVFVSYCNEAIELFSLRLNSDKTLKLKGNLKELDSIIEGLIEDLKVLPGHFSHFFSEIMQIKPNFYYSINSTHQNSLNYLQKLRSLPISTGVTYTQSLENLVTLKITEEKYREQATNLNTLEKNNFNLLKEIEKLRSEVVRVENELAAVEQNFERKTFETGKDLLHEPESISEDVKSGAQRFAIRLTDCNGEAVPLSQLCVSNDAYLKIQEIAVNKIEELSLQLKKYVGHNS